MGFNGNSSRFLLIENRNVLLSGRPRTVIQHLPTQECFFKLNHTLIVEDDEV